MNFLDFSTALPAEEKEIFHDLLVETGSTETAMKVMMLILAETEPKLAMQLQGLAPEPVKNVKLGLADRWAKRVQSFFGLDSSAS